MREISYFAAHGLNAGFVRTFYFPKQLYFNEITFPPQSPYSSQTGHGVAGMVLRNVAPRQGTETLNRAALSCKARLRNVAPRQGTETIIAVYQQRETATLRNVAPRQGTETLMVQLVNFLLLIEKCSSPIGAGNDLLSQAFYTLVSIEKCSSPIGDGNLCPSIAIITQVLLRNVAPRQGTETGCQNGRIIHAMTN